MAGLVLACMVSTAGGQTIRYKSSDFAPGFGLIYGDGKTDNGASIKKIGFTSRRMRENDHIGSLALIGEEHTNGIPYGLLGSGLEGAEVELRYQSLYMEIKRYFPISEQFYYYWGMRGGYSRVRGKILPGGGQPAREFRKEMVAPLALLALPLAIENPGFLLLAFLDGTSAGLTFDVVPNRIWLDYQLGTVLVPRYRDSDIVLDNLTIVTQTLQLAIVF